MLPFSEKVYHFTSLYSGICFSIGNCLLWRGLPIWAFAFMMYKWCSSTFYWRIGWIYFWIGVSSTLRDPIETSSIIPQSHFCFGYKCSLKRSSLMVDFDRWELGRVRVSLFCTFDWRNHGGLTIAGAFITSQSLVSPWQRLRSLPKGFCLRLLRGFCRSTMNCRISRGRCCWLCLPRRVGEAFFSYSIISRNTLGIAWRLSRNPAAAVRPEWEVFAESWGCFATWGEICWGFIGGRGLGGLGAASRPLSPISCRPRTSSSWTPCTTAPCSMGGRLGVGKSPLYSG